MLVRPHDRGIDGMLLVGWRPRFARVSNAASHTPSLLQRVNRTKTEFQLPYRSGMSRHGAPVRRTQRMPLTVRRLLSIAGPRSPRSGSSGSKMYHCSSVRSPRLLQIGSLESKLDSSVKNRQHALAAAKAASLAGLGALGISVPTTLLTVSDAEAQTAGMVRRQARREARRERRETRRAVRRGTAPPQ